VLTAGYLIARKGLRDLVAAAGRLRRAGRPIQLAIVGDGPLHDALLAQAAAEGVADDVHFLGRVEHARLLALMARADLFALPSWDEAFGLVYTEAMAQGTPVVAGKGEGPEDFIEDGASGYLVPVRDPAALADIIARVLDDLQKAARGSPARCTRPCRARRPERETCASTGS
jgi:glycosyltransferase involved in cell wall biosynthesis